jgi:hypothetical protein
MHPPFALHRAILNALLHEQPKGLPRLNDQGEIEVTWRGTEYIIRAIPKRQITYRAFLYREP